MQHYFVKEKIETGEFLPVYIPNKINKADLLMKLFPRDIMRNFIMDLRLYELKEMGEQEKPVE